MKSRPNVLILMCDQMQAHRIGMQDPVAYTPNLDQLARDGTLFTHLISTHGQCVASRASFMTGLYPHECGIMANYGFHGHKNMLTDRYRTLGHIFSDAGYRTAYFGKSHLRRPLEKLGFEIAKEYDGIMIPDDQAVALNIGHVHPKNRYNYKLANDAVDYLDAYTPDDSPLLFWYSTNLPHPPYFLDQRYREHFSGADMSLPESFHAETFDGKPAFQRIAATDQRLGVSDEKIARMELLCYYSMIAAMDEHFGRIIDAFKRKGLYENTLVLFFSDHGEMMGAHRMHKKGTFPYDELYRVPCIFKLPEGQAPARSRIDDLLSSVQLPGTLVQAAGIEMPDGFRHGGFHDVFFRDQHPVGERVFFEHYAAYWGIHPFYGIRTRDRKYVRYYGPDATEEFYDLEADPDELHNLGNDPDREPERKILRSEADRWWAETGGKDFAFYESDWFKANRYNEP